jgi:tetraacyldisaccharide 4'-kinase
MIERTFRKIWYDGGKCPAPTALMLLLSPFSPLYGRVVAARNKRFDLGFVKPARLPCRVVSIGNLTVGGTGKTPMVIHLAGMLRDRGFRPAVLSRGYGGTSKSPVNVVSRGSGPLMKEREAGDEPVLIAKSAVGIPVLTGPQRVHTGDWAIRNLNADVLVLDDGFQHRQLARDIDIVLLNAANPFGNGRLLPAGPLRETTGALKRADIIIATGTYDDVTTSRALMLPDGVHAPVFKCYYQPRKLLHGNPEMAFPPELLRGKKICAFAGIGSPTVFEKTLRSLGADVSVFIPFSDHHRYRAPDISLIGDKARQCGAQMIVTTEKDMIKLEAFDVFPGDIYALRIEMEFFDQSDDFIRLILDKLAKSPKFPPP